MRDFNAKNIGGNVIINDSSSEYKPLVQCSIEELLHEEMHRRSLLDKERSRKNRLFLWCIVAAILFLVAAYIWYQFKGEHSLGSSVIGVIGVLIGFTTFSGSDYKSEFEKRQIATLNEINMILRERGAR